MPSTSSKLSLFHLFKVSLPISLRKKECLVGDDAFEVWKPPEESSSEVHTPGSGGPEPRGPGRTCLVTDVVAGQTRGPAVPHCPPHAQRRRAGSVATSTAAGRPASFLVFLLRTEQGTYTSRFLSHRRACVGSRGFRVTKTCLPGPAPAVRALRCGLGAGASGARGGVQPPLAGGVALLSLSGPQGGESRFYRFRVTEEETKAEREQPAGKPSLELMAPDSRCFVLCPSAPTESWSLLRDAGTRGVGGQHLETESPWVLRAARTRSGERRREGQCGLRRWGCQERLPGERGLSGELRRRGHAFKKERSKRPSQRPPGAAPSGCRGSRGTRQAVLSQNRTGGRDTVQKPQRREGPECARGWRRMAGPSPYPAAPLGTFTQPPQPGGHEAALPKSEDGNGRWG